MIRRSMLFFGLGIAIMYMSVWVNSWLGVERSAVANVFAEGLTVAAWVSLWEALATLLVKWLPRRRSSKRYQRLASAELTFRSSIDTPAAGPDVPVHTDGSNRSAV
jgi:hypothetical protein